MVPIIMSAKDTVQVNWNIKEITINASDRTTWIISALDENKLNYHPVTGVTVEETVKMSRILPNNKFLNAEAMLGYSFCAKQVNASLSASILLRKTLISAEFGRNFVDYKGNIGNERLPNSIHSLLTKRNYKSMANILYVQSKVYTSLNRAATAEGTIQLMKVRHDENRTNFAFFRRDKDFAPNRPDNKRLTAESLEDRTLVQITACGTLWPAYRGYNMPQVKIGIEQGIGDEHHTHLTGHIEKNIGSDKETLWNMQIEGGAFWNNKKMNFIQWMQYKGSNEFFAIGDKRSGYHGFTTFGTYELSTNEWHLSVMANVITPHIIVRHIPLIARLDFKEEMYIKSAMISGDTVYTEVGYGWGQLMFNTLRATLFASFVDDKFKALRMRISFDL